MSQVRSFVAIHLNEETRDAVARVQGKLKACDAAVRWVKPESFHITLKFLGDIALEAVPQAAAILDDAIKDVSPFSLVFRGLNALPRLAQARVVYVGVEDEDGVLAPIAKALNDGMCALGVGREHRAFKPHLTIGRVKSRKRIESLVDMIGADMDIDFGTVDVRSVYLMSSELRPTGAVYSVLHEATL